MSLVKALSSTNTRTPIGRSVAYLNIMATWQSMVKCCLHFVDTKKYNNWYLLCHLNNLCSSETF